MARGMTERSFDELARGLASGTLSRGKALRLMGAALVGGALASLPGAAWADDRCSQGQTRCGDRCVNLQTNERHCGSCRNRCGPNQTCCNGRCVNLEKNENHCGSCFNRCAEGQECVGGVCQGGVHTCTEDADCTDVFGAIDRCCGGICVDILDDANCGACGNACPEGSNCCSTLYIDQTTWQTAFDTICCRNSEQCTSDNSGPLPRAACA
jgi:hypothetical protein